jgi:hypothetical protein
MGNYGRTTDEPRLKALREELEEIGRIQQSIQPSALSGYSALLACAEVVRRVGPQPTQAELGQAAHSAITDAITALPTPRDQQIAEAILAATAEYEGRNVDERKRILDHAHGCGPNIYKRQRPKILKLLVQHLESGVASDPLPSGDLAGYAASLDNLKCLCQDVARLRHSAIAYLFVCGFDEQLNDADSEPCRLRRQRSVIDALYSAYLELILSAGYCTDDARYSARTELLANLPAMAFSEISQRLSQIFERLPIDSSNRKHVCKERYESFRTLSDHRSHQGIMYYAFWKPWSEDHLSFAAVDEICLQSIVTDCNQLLLFVARSLYIQPNPVLPYENQPIDPIASYYGVDADAEILEGKSLRDHWVKYLEDRDSTMRWEGFGLPGL